MRVTEHEARKKWCPFARVEGNNRLMNMKTSGFDAEHMFHHCIGSQCMAWRSFHYTFVRDVEHDVEHHGYCGLAGRPEANN